MTALTPEHAHSVRPFSSYFPTTLLLGFIAGACGVWPDGARWLVIGPILLLIPGVVRRDLSVAVAGAAIGLVASPLCTAIASSYAPVKAADVLPLAIYATPGVLVIHGGISLGWQGKAFIGLFSYLLPVDIGMIALHGLRPVRLRRGLRAILASDLVVLLLYPLSWGARLSGRLPLSSVTFEVISLAVLVLVFPAKYLVLNWVYDPPGFRASREPDWTD